jgi:uncharacterized protein (DUF302 family)
MSKNMKKIIPVFVVLLGLVVFVWVNGENDKKVDASLNQSAIKVFHTESGFEDAKEDLLASISENGLVVSYTSHAKAMFERTAAVTGQKIPVYDDAEIILFCKADLSHDLVTADPHNIILCPYAIAIYVLHAEPNRVYLSYREQDESQAVTKPISELLTRIIADVI